MSELSRVIESLSPKQRAILELRLKKKRVDDPLSSITRHSRESGVLPLSYAQQRLWIIDQLEPHSALYNIPLALRLTGDLNLNALAQTFGEIVRRHEVLRTSFTTTEGSPVQLISTASDVELPLVNLSHLATDERETEAQRLAAAEAQRPFDLSLGPLFRVQVLRLSQTEHILLCTMHHIVSDGWSMGILIREVAALYEAFSQGQPSPLPELSIQYADYAVWQRQWLTGEVLESQLSYWREQLSGAPSVLELPTDYPRPAVQSFRGAAQPIQLSAELTEKLRQLSRAEGVTLFMTLLSAYSVLLSRLSGQDDIVVGTPIANRTRVETESLIGFFVNTLVLRTKVEAEESFRALLARVREVTLGAYSHQEVPFEKLVEELQPDRDLSHSPLFQVLFTLQNTAMGELELAGSQLTQLEVETETAKFDLTLVLTESGEGVTGVWQYSTELFAAETIERWGGHFLTMLEAIASEPEQAVAELPLLTEGEREQLLVEWNQTAREYPRERCVHELFEEQVERTPEAVAVVYEDERVTYGELNSRANQLAHYLRGMGVGPEVLVGICVERSVEMVIGLLGILKAGGAYVPLDPEYPRERLAFMLEDARVSVLLTEERLLEKLPASEARVVLLDVDWERISHQSGKNGVSEVSGANRAYVIYTSGSTGSPKGVQILHGALVNFLTSMSQRPGLRESDSLLAVTTLSFDIAALELYLPLVVGAQLTVVGRREVADGESLKEKLRRTKATVMQATPTTWRLLLDAGWKSGEEMKILCGGEALPLNLARELVANGAPVWNMYGPTETTIWSGAKEIHDNIELVTIGCPIANTQFYILDTHSQPAPVGVAGELYIGGAGLARGYLKRPDLTAERFVPHPFSTEPGARLYRTGDLAKYLPDGNIEFLGRIDQQVKLRGYRIELGEIETVLGQHPEIEQAVVTLTAQGSEQRLVAYLVAARELQHGELRSYLKERLPDYMIPSTFVQLAELPLTPNGKIDRRALPEPTEGRLEAGQEYVAAQTPVEELLVGIWEEVLGVERVGVHDNFFELGGHSLLATQLISRVRAAFEIEMPLRQLFESPTVQELAVAVEAALRQELAVSAPAIERAPREQGLLLSYAQQRLWFIDQLEPNSALYNIPAAVRLKGELNTAALEQTFGEIIRRHEVLRTRFATVNGSPVQLISAALPFSLPVVDLSDVGAAEREAEAQRLATAEAQRPFDLSLGPLFRVRLLRLSATEHILLCTMHHIVSDGWSIWMLVREVATLYEAFSQGRPYALPELPIQYADYALWQREWLTGEVLETQLAYWREQLQGAPAVLELPTDHPRPAVQSFRGAAHRIELSAELTERLRQLSRAEGVTLFMTLLSAFSVLLSRLSGQDDIVVGTPIANRTRVETEGLIGFFVNTLVLRTKVEAEESFRELLRRVREVTLGAYSHQEVPFEKLVEELQPERDLSHSPLFQVLFTLQNAPLSDLKLRDIELSSLQNRNGTAKFDLALELTNSEWGAVGTIEYNRDLFDEETIERFSGHFQTLLDAIVGEPEQRVAELAILTHAERAQLLVEWNQTGTQYPSQSCIHELFEEQVERTPEAVAVVYKDERMTYAELNSRANQLAHYLRSRGVGPEALVGICVERSVEMVVGLLGILKAGGAYVPLDPEYPAPRLSFMLEDAAPTLLLTQAHLLPLLPRTTATPFCLDAQWAAVVAGLPTTNLGVRLEPGHAAYAIYTSGSTGRPKCAVNTHGGISNRLRWMQETYGLGSSDVVLQKTAFSFDVSVWEFFWPLMTGARLVLARQGLQRDAGGLAELIREQGVSVLHFVPAMLQVMLEEPSWADCRSVRLVVASGEALMPEVVARFREQSVAELENLYGPTEAAVDVTRWRCRPSGESSAELRSVPIGRPIANIQLYILDEEQEPVPVGVAGELYIGGVGLARGYLKRPELTAERFVPHPFSAKPGARLYRTGDLAKYLPDGNIEFLGRVDQQVKLRGYRIELGEIETVLGQHPEIEQAVVILSAQGSEPRLVAYLVAEQDLGQGELRGYLKERLPEYMVPAVFVQLEALPLTPNGKIDRKALPAPEEGRIEAGQEYVAPQTQVEELLVGVWEAVLGVERVGVYDNFFELGGDSILSIQIVARANKSGLNLAPNLIFQYQTIAQLASVAEERKGSTAEQELVTGQVSLTPAQRRFFEFGTAVPRSDIAGIFVELRQALDPSVMEKAVAHLLAHHDALRMRFVLEATGWQQFNARAEEFPVYARIDLSALKESEQEAELSARAIEAQESLNLSDGPLLRVTHFELGGGRAGRLLIVVHRLVCDETSERLLLEDLERAVRQISSGQTVQLGPKTTSFKRWARLLWEHAQTTAALEEWPYWSSETRRKVAPLPLDYTEQARAEEASQTLTLRLPAAETRALLEEVPLAYQTRPGDVLLTALAQAFSRWTGKRSLLLDIEGSAREGALSAEADLSRTVGSFKTVYPALLDLGKTATPWEALKTIKEQLREVPQSGIGYGALRYLREDEEIARSLSAMPQAELHFEYVETFAEALADNSLFKGVEGPDPAAGLPPGYLLGVTGRLTGGQLQLTWAYHKSAHRRETIESLAQSFMEALRAIIEHCQAPDAGGYTPSDFPRVRLSQAELDHLFAEKRKNIIEDIYPLSPMQQGLLFHTLLAPESGIYFEQVDFTIHQDLNIPAFERAWQRVLDRHSILRTAFIWENREEPFQIVYSHLRLPIVHHDWRGLQPAEQQERLKEFLRADLRRGFELSQAPLMRVALIRMADDAYQLIWGFHHLLLDGWSNPMVMNEVFAFYEGFAQDEDVSLKQPTPFGDYIAWLQRQDMARAETFWREQLKGFTRPTPLLRDRSHAQTRQTPAIEVGGNKLRAQLSPETTAALKSLAQRHHLTLNTLAQGAWALLLNRYSGEEDIVFGITVSGRPAELAEPESMIGMFINTLPVRVPIVYDAPLIPWLKQLQAQQAELRQYDYSPLVQVQRWSEVPLGTLLFETLLVFENYPVDSSLRRRGKNLDVRNVRFTESQTYPLCLVLWPDPVLDLLMIYDRSRFDAATVTRMLSHFKTLLTNIAANPESRLIEIPLLAESGAEEQTADEAEEFDFQP